MITRLLLIAAPVLAFTTADGPFRPVINLLLIVFLVFGCVWLFLDIRRQLTADCLPDPAPAPVPLAAPLAPAPVAACDDAIPANVVAVIAAAVHYAFGGSAHVVAITPGTGLPGQSPFTWSTEGRRSHYSSHKVR